MKQIEKLVPTTPLYTPKIQQSTIHKKEQQKPLPHLHKYNTRTSKVDDEATLPRVGQANIIYKGTPININEVFT